MKDTNAGRERLNAARKRDDDYLARAVQQMNEKLFKRPKVEESFAPGKVVLLGGGGSVIAVASAGAAPSHESRPDQVAVLFRLLVLPAPLHLPLLPAHHRLLRAVLPVR